MNENEIEESMPNHYISTKKEKEIAENIKKFRDLKGITREVMASDLGMSVSGYAKLERNETELTIYKPFKITEILGVSIHEILNFDANKIFNISHNKMVQGFDAHNVHLHNHPVNHNDKYIALLESENERLRGLVEKK